MVLGERDRGRRGRPRSEAVELAITEGVLHLLEEGVSLAELSIERIARTAGVGKAAIYRRWSGKDELLVEVLATLEGPPPEPRGESVRDDLVAAVDSIRPRDPGKRSAAILRFALTEARRHPKLAAKYHEAVAEPRRRALRDAIRRGVESGELRADLDPDMLIELFSGPMLVRTVLHDQAPLPEDFAARTVDAVLEGVRARTP